MGVAAATLFQAGPALIQTSAIWFLDESPRWLCYCKIEEEAFAILVKHHGEGDPNHPLPIAEYHEMCEALRQEKEIRHKGLRLFSETPANRKRLFILVSLPSSGSGAEPGSYRTMLTKILSSIGIEGQKKQTRLNRIVTTVNYVTSVLAVLFATQVGRRVLFVGGGIFMWLQPRSASPPPSPSTRRGVPSHRAGRLSASSLIYNTAYNFCLIPTLYLYSTEILPYRLRAMGLSISVFTTKASLFFSQFVNPIGMASIGWKYYLVYVVVGCHRSLDHVPGLPETRGHSLETMPEVFGEHVLDTSVDKILSHNEADLAEVGGDVGGYDNTKKPGTQQVEDVGNQA